MLAIRQRLSAVWTPTVPQPSLLFLAEEFRKLVATLYEKGFDKAIATQRQQMFGQDSMQVLKGKLVVRAHWSIRYPDSRFSLLWDSTQLLLLVWVMFSVSHSLAFLAWIGSPCLRRGVHGDPIRVRVKIMGSIIRRTD
eukprot:COSAG01_NODE_2026_length_8601_cov_74.674430_6_plen_138_part_00